MYIGGKKRRPSLMMVVILVVMTLSALPLIGLLAARLTSNQFVQETEASLLAQAAVYSAAYAEGFRATGLSPILGHPLTAKQRIFYNQRYHHRPPSLSVREHKIAEPRPAPMPIRTLPLLSYRILGQSLSRAAINAQKTSLAGYLALDYEGRVIGGSGQIEGSFAHLPEIRAALSGEVVSLLRQRADRPNNHPLSSISRDTYFRVFVAMPVIVSERVVGVVYLARTPSNIRKFLHRERQTLALVAASVLLAATLVGFFLWRLLERPIRNLRRQSEEVAKGQSDNLTQLAHYGTKDIKSLADSLFSMTDRLRQSSVEIQNYTAHVTHELKSPLTAISGAVELLQSSGDKMDDAARDRFYSNMEKDSQRMARLLDELRGLANLGAIRDEGESDLREVVKVFAGEFDGPRIEVSGETHALPIGPKCLSMVLTHLVQNAAQAGAKKVDLVQSENGFVIQDDGSGINANVSDTVFDPFFTTKREDGGTGLGLTIVRDLLRVFHADIELLPSEQGSKFEITFQSQDIVD